MSIPKHLLREMWDRTSIDRYQRKNERIDCGRCKTPIHYITFATSDWPKAIRRASIQSGHIQSSFGYFKSVSILGESSLQKEWLEATSRHESAPGFRWYSWKPWIISDALSKIQDGEVLLYLDAGCTFPLEVDLTYFFSEMNSAVDRMVSSGTEFGLCKNQYYTSCRAAVSTDILRFFGLESDNDFTDTFPHWENGTMLIVNTPRSRNLMNTWRDTMILNLDTLFANPVIGLKGFVHNSGDQSVLQCMLYNAKTKIYDTSGLFYGHGVYARQRG